MSLIAGIRSSFQRLCSRVVAHPVLLLFLATLGVVAFLNPMKVGLLLWGVTKVLCFAWLGGFIDRQFFRNAQPEQLDGIEQGTAWKRKSAVICACVVAGALLP